MPEKSERVARQARVAIRRIKDRVLLSASRFASLRMNLLKDRVDARRRLAQRLDFLRGQDVVVIALPRGEVPVAFEVGEVQRPPNR